MKFEVFLRRLKHLKYIKNSINEFNSGLTKLVGDPMSNEGIYVPMLDYIFDSSVDQFVMDVESSENVDSDQVNVELLIEFFIYEGSFGSECGLKELFLDNFKEPFDLTVWNLYCACIGTINEEIADTDANPKVKI